MSLLLGLHTIFAMVRLVPHDAVDGTRIPPLFHLLIPFVSTRNIHHHVNTSSTMLFILGSSWVVHFEQRSYVQEWHPYWWIIGDKKYFIIGGNCIFHNLKFVDLSLIWRKFWIVPNDGNLDKNESAPGTTIYLIPCQILECWWKPWLW